MKAQAETYRAKLVEAVASADDKLIEKYLGDEPISQEELETALKAAVISGKVVPVYTGSALQNIGVTLLMDAIQQYLPSPKSHPVEITDPAKQTTSKVEPSSTDSLGCPGF